MISTMLKKFCIRVSPIAVILIMKVSGVQNIIREQSCAVFIVFSNFVIVVLLANMVCFWGHNVFSFYFIIIFLLHKSIHSFKLLLLKIKVLYWH